MSISDVLEDYLYDQNVDYEIIHHRYTKDSASAAITCNVPREQLAKAVMLEDEKGYLMAVVPSDAKVSLGNLRRITQRKLGLATEQEIFHLFHDCEPGAIPPIGPAFDIETIIEDELLAQSEIWLEAGDHEDLLHLSGDNFRVLMRESQHTHFSL